jgi:hypothetical protein
VLGRGFISPDCLAAMEFDSPALWPLLEYAYTKSPARAISLYTALMKVDKAQFDSLLRNMLHTPPEPRTAIKTEGKAGKIIPGPTAAAKPSPRKA